MLSSDTYDKMDVFQEMCWFLCLVDVLSDMCAQVFMYTVASDFWMKTSQGPVFYSWFGLQLHVTFVSLGKKMNPHFILCMLRYV